MSLEQRHELFCGFGDVKGALDHLLSDEGLLQRLRLRPHDEDAALGLEVGSGRRQRGEGGRYRRVNAAMLEEYGGISVAFQAI